jgi:CyaY protein
MDQSGFLKLADEALTEIAKWLENLDPDEVDYTAGDGVITVDFPDGGRFILSRQSATGQLWLAAAAHAWHYNRDESTQTWVDDKDGHELHRRLAEVISEKIGRDVKFAS